MKTYNLLLHRKQTNCDSMLPPILTLFARISKPLWLNICSIGAEVTGRHKTFSSNGCSTLCHFNPTILSQFHASWVTKTESPWSQVPSPKTKTKTLEVPRPRPRPRLVKTGLETKTQVSRTPSLPDCHSALAYQISSEPNHTLHSYDCHIDFSR